MPSGHGGEWASVLDQIGADMAEGLPALQVAEHAGCPVRDTPSEG